jgi:hypothetical protein
MEANNNENIEKDKYFLRENSLILDFARFAVYQRRFGLVVSYMEFFLVFGFRFWLRDVTIWINVTVNPSLENLYKVFERTL